jgi:hypothetical protein
MTRTGFSTDSPLMSFVLVRTDTLETLPIGTDSVFVGSAEWKADLCLAGDGVDEVHCELAADPHGIRVESLSPDGVQVNGQTIQSALLFANDKLAIGPFEFRIERARFDPSRPTRQLPTTLHAAAVVAFEADDAESIPPADSGPAVVDNETSAVARSEYQSPPRSDIARDEPSRQASWTSPIQATAEKSALDGGTIESPPNSPDRPSASPDSAIDEPQYFIQRRSSEEGPLPRSAVQELVSRGELSAETPVRLEWNSHWSSAAELGFAYPDAGLETPLRNEGAESRGTSEHSPAASVTAGVRWGLIAPFFYARSMTASLRSLSLKHLVLLLLAGGSVSIAAQRIMNRYARTALTGTVLLDDQPLGDVTVTLTGMKSGEVASGVADSSGRFQVLTLSGTLSPGPYRITVQPEAGPGATVPHGKGKQIVPVHYAVLSTSDVTVDVTAGQTDYELQLSRLPRSSSARRARASNY